MNIDIKKQTILLVISGSRAYGMDTPESDVDVKGVAVAPKEYYLGFLNNFEQADKASHMTCFYDALTDEEKKKADEGEFEGSIYDIQKFFKLASNANPNILDVLFCRDEDIRVVTPAGKMIRDNRDLFLSKKVKFTFSGYAMSQLKRIKTHRRWLLEPMKQAPTRSEFGLPEHKKLLRSDQLEAAESVIKKKLDEWEIDFGDMDDAGKIYIQDQISNYLSEINVTSDDKYIAAAKAVGLDDNLIEFVLREREYKTKMRNWKQYQEWKRSRNPKRAALEEKHGYDCYSHDTEFLTDKGWKLFDDIDEENDRLATVYIGKDFFHRKFGKIEYQLAVDKFDGIFNGELYNLYGYHLNTLVTPNHRMLIREVEKRGTGRKHDWKLCEVANLPDTFEVFVFPTPNIKNYSNQEVFKDILIKPEAFLRFMGWFLADGTICFRNNKSGRKVTSINISQKKGGKLCQGMTKFNNKYGEKINCSLYKYNNPPSGFRKESIVEYILSVRDKNIINKIYEECGHSKDKKIPRWVFSLSKRLKEILLDAMVLGDGTIRKCGYNSIIYYSNSYSLAGDIQELALGCGFETSLYGPYEHNMYQVHINKNVKQFRILVRSKNIKKESVTNKRIVCFTVPNGTLITRRKGHIGIHGNSKHASHLVRLFRMCKEILTTGSVNVYRPDADELLAIRNGAWSYEQLIEFAEKEDAELNKLYKESSLRHSPDRNKLDALCVQIIEGFLNGTL